MRGGKKGEMSLAHSPIGLQPGKKKGGEIGRKRRRKKGGETGLS